MEDNLFKSSPSGFCVLCATKSSLVCHRCGDFYCSKHCQQKDWQRHRYICFSLPALVHPLACSALATVELPPASVPAIKPNPQKIAASNGFVSANNADETQALLTKKQAEVFGFKTPTAVLAANSCVDDKKHTSTTVPASNNNNNNKNNNNTSSSYNKSINVVHKTCLIYVEMPPSNSLVYITGFRSPNRCFIRDASESAENAFLNICEKVNALSEKLPKMQKLKVHQYALAKYNGQFQRVQIIAARNDFSARMLYVDLGIVKLRSGAEMREISSDILELPCHSLQVHLTGVPNYALGNEVCEFLEQFEGKRFIVSYEGNDNLELLDVDTKKSLNTQIRKFCSDMQVFETESQVDKKLNPFKNGKKCTEHKYEENVSQATVDFKPKSNEKQPTNIEQINTTVAQLEISTEQNLIKNQTAVINNKQNNKPEQLPNSMEIYLDTAATTKPNENVTNHKVTLEIKPAIVATNNQEKENGTNNSVQNLQTEIDTETNEIPKETPATTMQNLKPASPSAENQKAITSNDIAKSNAAPMLTAPFEMKCFDSQKKGGLDLFIVDNSSISRGIIGAFECTYACEFSDLHTHLSEFKDTQPYRPALKEYVIAKFEGGWFRAKVMGIKPNQHDNLYNVMYIDFTNVSTVSEQSIRRYPADLTVPCVTNICLIEGFPHKATKAQEDYLNEKMQMNCVLHVDSVKYLRDMAVINCKTLIDELNKFF